MEVDNPPHIVEAFAEFHKLFGEAMAAWSLLEHALAQIFRNATGLTQKKANRIFFSVRTFGNRADLLAGALSAYRAPRPVVDLLQAILKKANGYSGTRNKLAHNFPALHPLGAAKAEVLLLPNKSMSRKERRNVARHKEVITINDLKQILKNFNSLLGIAAFAGHKQHMRLRPWRDRLLGRLDAAPNLPYSKTPPKNFSKQKHPPRSSPA